MQDLSAESDPRVVQDSHCDYSAYLRIVQCNADTRVMQFKRVVQYSADPKGRAILI